MLIALLTNSRIHAAVAERGPIYTCPACRSTVILKKGRIKTHHFAHKPPTDCAWAKGETEAHLKAKDVFYRHFLNKGISTEVEYPFFAGSERLRADVYVVGNKGNKAVIELQHTPISLDEIERRTQGYFSLGIALTWIPLLQLSKFEYKINPQNQRVITKYSPRPFERWLHGFNYGHIWYFDADAGYLWRGELKPHKIDVEYNEWYTEGGEHHSAGGYSRFSRRWKTLILTGPFPLATVKWRIKKRDSFRQGNYNYPAGYLLATSQ